MPPSSEAKPLSKAMYDFQIIIGILLVLLLIYASCMGLVLLIEWVQKRLARQQGRPSIKRAAILAAVPVVGVVITLWLWLLYQARISPLSYQFPVASPSIPLPPPAPPPPPPPPPSQVDSALAELPKGSATVTAPSEVLQYQGFDVSLRLARKSLAGLIEDTKLKAPQGATVQGIARVRMSPRMKAELIGEDFVIEDKGLREQVVTYNEDTVWTWRVYSELPGSHILKVRLHTLLKVTGQEAPRTIDVAEAQVAVKVNPSEWALRHWEWIATALVLPIIGWGLKRLFDKDKK